MGAAVRAASGRQGRRPGPRPAFSGILSWELPMKKRNWLAAGAPAVIGESSSSITLPMAQYLVKEGVAHVNIGSSSTKVRALGGAAYSLIGLEDAGNRHAARDTYGMGWRKIAVIVPNNAFGQGVAEGFRHEFEKLGGKVLAQVLYAGGQSSYRREL